MILTWTRRDFLKSASGAALAALMPSESFPSLLPMPAGMQQQPPAANLFELKPVADGIFARLRP